MRDAGVGEADRLSGPAFLLSGWASSFLLVVFEREPVAWSSSLVLLVVNV